MSGAFLTLAEALDRYESGLRELEENLAEQRRAAREREPGVLLQASSVVHTSLARLGDLREAVRSAHPASAPGNLDALVSDADTPEDVRLAVVRVRAAERRIGRIARVTGRVLQRLAQHNDSTLAVIFGQDQATTYAPGQIRRHQKEGSWLDVNA